MTAYDEIWIQFLEINKTSEINLPRTDEGKYNAIRSGVRHYNNRLQDLITCDDTVEIINENLNDDKIILIAHYIKLSFLEKQLVDFSTTWNPFSKDVGVKNIQAQISALKDLINFEKATIEELILNSSEDYI
jgi:hypothetical protein